MKLCGLIEPGELAKDGLDVSMILILFYGKERSNKIEIDDVINKRLLRIDV